MSLMRRCADWEMWGCVADPGAKCVSTQVSVIVVCCGEDPFIFVVALPTETFCTTHLRNNFHWQQFWCLWWQKQAAKYTKGVWSFCDIKWTWGVDPNCKWSYLQCLEFGSKVKCTHLVNWTMNSFRTCWTNYGLHPLQPPDVIHMMNAPGPFSFLLLFHFRVLLLSVQNGDKAQVMVLLKKLYSPLYM